MHDQMQEPVRIEVDFRTVDPDGRMWVPGRSMGPDTLVEAYDRTGSRCRAVVVAENADRVQLDLLLDTFRTAAE